MVYPHSADIGARHLSLPLLQAHTGAHTHHHGTEHIGNIYRLLVVCPYLDTLKFAYANQSKLARQRVLACHISQSRAVWRPPVALRTDIQCRHSVSAERQRRI